MRTKTIHKRNKEMELGFSNPIEFDLPDIQVISVHILSGTRLAPIVYWREWQFESSIFFKKKCIHIKFAFSS